MSCWAVILAGGVGSRFWPLSTPRRPKQLLPLITDSPLLADTVARLAALVPAERTLVVTNASLAAAVRALLPELPPENVIAEPRAAGTAPALAYAAATIARRGDADDVMLCVHADWAIGNDTEFRATLARAAALADREHNLVTVGIVLAPVVHRALPHPGIEHGPHRLRELLARLVLELLAGLVAEQLLELARERIQVIHRQLNVQPHAGAPLVLGDQVLVALAGDAAADVPEHLDEAPVGVPREAFVVRHGR